MKKAIKKIKSAHLNILYKRLQQMQFIINKKEEEFCNEYTIFRKGQYVCVRYKDNSIRTAIALITDVNYKHTGYKSGFNIEVQPYKKDFNSRKINQYSYWINRDDSYKVEAIKKATE